MRDSWLSCTVASHADRLFRYSPAEYGRRAAEGNQTQPRGRREDCRDPPQLPLQQRARRNAEEFRRQAKSRRDDEHNEGTETPEETFTPRDRSAQQHNRTIEQQTEPDPVHDVEKRGIGVAI